MRSTSVSPTPPSAPTAPMSQSSTGRARRRKTSASVRIADRTAKVFITAGGVATILAVSLVCFFLAWVVVPLFLGSDVGERRVAASGLSKAAAAPVALGVDEYNSLAWSLFADGDLRLVELAGGTELDRLALLEGGASALRFGAGGEVALGLEDGGFRLGRVGFATRFLTGDDVPAELSGLPLGERAVYGKGVAQRTSSIQVRVQELEVTLGDELALDNPSSVVLIDHSPLPTGPMVALLTEDGRLRFRRILERRNMMTGRTTTTISGSDLAVEPRADGEAPIQLLLSGRGDTVYLVWSDGETRRFDTRDPSALTLAEVVDLVPESGAQLTALTFMIGKTSLLSGDSDGRVRAWFRVKPDAAATSDGSLLVPSHTFQGQAAVRALAISSRDRKIAAGFADGTARMYHVTSEQLLAEVFAETDAAIDALVLSPKDDGLFAASGGRLISWDVDAPHPETTLAAMFRPIWYEGYTGPEHVWQSSSGTDDFEPKYGLVPLIFGSLKATLYSMLFGVPIALLAAIYTAEFLKPRTKARIKPTIELMASLPSVVLGFLAALIFAPFVEDIVPEVLVTFVGVPFFVLLGAYLWNLLPERRALGWAQYRMVGMFAALPIAMWAASGLGPIVERTFFWVDTPMGPKGDLRVWLSGAPGAGGAGGWLFAMLPLSAILAAWLSARYVTPYVRNLASTWTRAQLARVDLVKFLTVSAATVLFAIGASYALDAVLFDARGAFLGTYVQRNALIVGFVMGFAVIPIIYTISEDALSAVPEQLRAASLGAGATPWQTAVRIVIPTAMSGLFSAIMIGFGRAVGETMIVLMAAGNTPLMEWNIFNGFRTLSANIAVELPEAAVNSTHYRMLFLAALTLFGITFVLNTVAEIVRTRYRKRAFQL